MVYDWKLTKKINSNRNKHIIKTRKKQKNNKVLVNDKDKYNRGCLIQKVADVA